MLEHNLLELLKFYPMAPTMNRGHLPDMTVFDVASLLCFAKTTVRNYSISITETATPILRETFQKQLIYAIDLHAMIFNFMCSKGYYPAYNLEQLLCNDVNMATAALRL